MKGKKHENYLHSPNSLVIEIKILAFFPALHPRLSIIQKRSITISFRTNHPRIRGLHFYISNIFIFHLPILPSPPRVTTAAIKSNTVRLITASHPGRYRNEIHLVGLCPASIDLRTKHANWRTGIIIPTSNEMRRLFTRPGCRAGR